MSDAPLLRLDHATIHAHGASLAEGLSLSLDGPRAVLVGDAEPVLAPLFHRGQLVSGTFELLGQPLAQLDPARLGLAPLEPPLPLRLSPLDIVRWSAHLAGLSAVQSRTRAEQLCALLGLGVWASHPLGTLHAAYHRLTVLAHALVTDPPLVVIEAPLAGLDEAAADYVLQALARVAEGRALLLSTSPPRADTAEQRLVEGADHSVSLGDGMVRDGSLPIPADVPVVAVSADGEGSV